MCPCSHSFHDLVYHLLSSTSLDLNSISLTGESEAFNALQTSSELEFPLTSMSQSALQAPLDEISLTDLLSKSNIREQARLNTLSESTKTSGWLHAVLLANLGLSMCCNLAERSQHDRVFEGERGELQGLVR